MQGKIDHYKSLAGEYSNLPIEFLLTQYRGVVSHTDDAEIDGTYEVNSNGYRSPEFDGDAQLVTLGCSQTFGVGVRNKTNWPYLLADKLDLKLANLAVVGSSIQLQLDVLLSYLNSNPAPKIVVLLAPGLERVRLPVRTDVVGASDGSEQTFQYLYDVVHTNLAIRDTNTEEIPNYSKKPYDLFELLPYEFAVAESIRALSHISMLCAIRNIKFVFSAWEPVASYYLSSLGGRLNTDIWKELDMSNYIPIESSEDFLIESMKYTCHSNQSNHSAPGWYVGTDKAEHIGEHHHIHIAEAFYAKLVM